MLQKAIHNFAVSFIVMTVPGSFDYTHLAHRYPRVCMNELFIDKTVSSCLCHQNLTWHQSDSHVMTLYFINDRVGCVLTDKFRPPVRGTRHETLAS